MKNCIKDGLILLFTKKLAIVILTCSSLGTVFGQQKIVKSVDQRIKTYPPAIVDYSLLHPISNLGYEIVYDGQKAQVIIKDVNRMLYQCHFTEQQNRYREEDNIVKTKNFEFNGPKLTVYRSADLSSSSIPLDDQQYSQLFKLRYERDSLKQELNISQNHELSSYLTLSLVETKADSIKFLNQIDSLAKVIRDMKNHLVKKEEQLASSTSFSLLLRSDLMDIEEIMNDIVMLETLRNELVDLLSQDRNYNEIKRSYEKRKQDFISEQKQASNDLAQYAKNIEKRFVKLKGQLPFYFSNYELSPDQKRLLSNFSLYLLEIEEKVVPHVRKINSSIFQLDNWVGDPNNFQCSYTTSILRSNVDVINVSVDIKPIEEIIGRIPGIDSYSEIFEFRAKRGIKLDFSGGLAFHPSFPSTFSLHDDNIELVSLSDSSTSLLYSRSNDWFIPNAIALANIYWRRAGKVNCALSIGAGTDLRGIDYYLGLSVLLGREDMLVFTIGTVLGRKQVMKTEYELALKHNDGLVNRPIDEMLQVSLYHDKNLYRLGSFFSFSYNFTAKTEKAWKDRFTDIKSK